MSCIQVVTVDSFSTFTQELKLGLDDYLPMVFGTKTESLKKTEWMNAFDDGYYWLIDDLDPGRCSYLLRKAEGSNALWFSFIMPSDWKRRFDIFHGSLPGVIAWFDSVSEYGYLYATMGTPETPPTLLEAFLPTFLRNGFSAEYRMAMKREGSLPVPEGLPLPDGVTRQGYSEGMVDEIAALNSRVFEEEGFSFSHEDAKRYVSRCAEKDLFKRSAVFLRDQRGRLAGFVWVEDSDGPYLGEFIVDHTHQGKGLGRYLLNEAIRFVGESYPGQDMRLGTGRELKRAVRLYEAYGFAPYDFGINLNLRKNLES